MTDGVVENIALMAVNIPLTSAKSFDSLVRKPMCDVTATTSTSYLRPYFAFNE